nr:phosphatase PAP2 family protein [Lacticaseibacillus manihotivorans]
MSFPSGHTETAALSLLFPLFVDRKNARLQRLVFWLAHGYGIAMAISRVRILAHFTGDVTTSLVIVWSVILLVTTVANLPLVNWVALPQRKSSKSTQAASPAAE